MRGACVAPTAARKPSDPCSRPNPPPTRARAGVESTSITRGLRRSTPPGGRRQCRRRPNRALGHGPAHPTLDAPTQPLVSPGRFPIERGTIGDLDQVASENTVVERGTQRRRRIAIRDYSAYRCPRLALERLQQDATPGRLSFIHRCVGVVFSQASRRLDLRRCAATRSFLCHVLACLRCRLLIAPCQSRVAHRLWRSASQKRSQTSALASQGWRRRVL